MVSCRNHVAHFLDIPPYPLPPTPFVFNQIHIFSGFSLPAEASFPCY